MMRGPNRIRESEIRRAIKAAKKAGGGSVELDPATGRIIVHLNQDAAQPTENEWDRYFYGTGETTIRNRLPK
jgi:hypothetical protein